MRNVWKSAREKKRRDARFAIRERVAAVESTFSKTKEKNIEEEQQEDELVDPSAAEDFLSMSAADTCHSDFCIVTSDDDRLPDLQEILSKLHKGDRSFFSLSLLAEHYLLLSSPISTHLLLEHLPIERMISIFGESYLQQLTNYLQDQLEAIYIMEYAVLIGRYHVVGALLLGGVSPCQRGLPKVKPQQPYYIQQHGNIERDLQQQQQQQLSHQVLQRFFDFFPLSLSSYIVKRVVDMRRQALRLSQSQPRTYSFCCQLCQQDVPPCYRLEFTPANHLFTSGCSESCCHCSFCEVCFWNDLLLHVDERMGEDIVLCPCCSSQSTTSSHDSHNFPNMLPSLTPQERGKASKQKFDLLPIDSKTLKGLGGKRRKIPELFAPTASWSQAVLPSLGLCQSVRQDKLFTYTENGALHYAKGCLEVGADVNATNDYGQTPLYVAVWYENNALVKLMLDYGANPWICANGYLTLDGLCRSHGNDEIYNIIQRYREHYWQASTPSITDLAVDEFAAQLNNLKLDEPDPITETLIDLQRDHPGAGSYLISDCIQAAISPLLKLWELLPVDQTSAKTAKKKGACSDRSYFCDAEGWLRALLKRRIVEALRYDGIRVNETSITVLPQMRFLNYNHVGSSLAPHVDLCRVDHASGQRSTHSFLLYLTTCDHGGETVLLEDISGKSMLARVKPRTGDLLLFPHDCPHEGNAVQDVPKLLIRGEVILPLKRAID